MNFSKQVKIYLGKCFRIFKNEKAWKCFITTIIIGVLVCFVTGEALFAEPRPTENGNFTLASACIWIGIFNSIQSVCRERAIVKREHRTGMLIPAYCTAHFIYEAFLCIVEALILVAIVYLFNSGRILDSGVIFPSFLEMLIDYFLILYSADMLALLISCICKTESTAMTVMPFVLIVQLVLGGLIFKLDGVANTISTLTISKWGLRSLCVSANVNSLQVPGGDLTKFWATVDAYEFEKTNQLLLWLRLIVFSAIYQGLAMFSLSFVDKDKR